VIETHEHKGDFNELEQACHPAAFLGQASLYGGRNRLHGVTVTKGGWPPSAERARFTVTRKSVRWRWASQLTSSSCA
jgi:hypothetical protein